MLKANTTKLELHLSYLAAYVYTAFHMLLIDELLLQIAILAEICIKNALFLLKNCKNRSALGLSPQTPSPALRIPGYATVTV